MNALWWWIDRWRKSTAYTDMTLAEQGAYRNLLDEATLRGGALPNDERVLAKACGDARAWGKVRSAVMARFQLREDGLHNETLDGVLWQSERRKKNQANYRARLDSGGGNGGGNAPDSKTDNKPASPDPDLSSTKNPPLGSLRERRPHSKLEAERASANEQLRKTVEFKRLIAGGMSRAEANRQVFGP